MATYSIKEARTEDLYDIEAMCIAFHQNSPYANLVLSRGILQATILEFITSPDAAILVARNEEGTAVGFAACIKTKLLFTEVDIAAEVVWWVEPEHRSSKIGTLILNKFEEWAKYNNCAIATMSMLDNADSERIGEFYKRSGYKLSERAYIKEIT